MKKRTKQKLPLLERVKMAHEAIDYQLRTKKFGKNLTNEKLESIRIKLKNVEEKYVDKHLRAVKDRKDIIKDVNYVLRKGNKNSLMKHEFENLFENQYGVEMLKGISDLTEEKVKDLMFARKQAKFLFNKMSDLEKEEFLTSDYGSKLEEKDFYSKYEADVSRVLKDYKQDLFVMALVNFMKKKGTFVDIEKFSIGDKELKEFKEQVKNQITAKQNNTSIDDFNAHILYLQLSGREKEAQEIINARTAKALATKAQKGLIGKKKTKRRG